MSTQQILGWGAWVLLFLFAISWSVGCYLYIKRGAGLTYATLNTTIIWWLLLGWTFYYSNLNKLHLLWLAPSVVPVASVTTISRALSSMGRKKMIPPGLFLLLVGYGFVLWWLTD
jgi:hypothetical protein